MAIQERLKHVMSPQVPKKEEYISSILESWVTELRDVSAHGDQYTMPAAFRIMALRSIMSIKPDHYDQIFKAREGIVDNDERYKFMLEDIREFANRKRLDGFLKRSRDLPTPMEIGELQDRHHEESREEVQWYECDNWVESDDYEGSWDQGIDALGKGKAMRKGKGKRHIR